MIFTFILYRNSHSNCIYLIYRLSYQQKRRSQQLIHQCMMDVQKRLVIYTVHFLLYCIYCTGIINIYIVMYTIYTIEYAEKINNNITIKIHIQTTTLFCIVVSPPQYTIILIMYCICYCNTIDPELCTADVWIRHWKEGV